jgi:hypothetical protein
MSRFDANHEGTTGFRRAMALADLAPAGSDAVRFALLPEADRVALILRSGQVPDRCGPVYPVAPARGLFEVIDFQELVPGSDTRTRPTGWRERSEARVRSTVRVGDAFSLMEEQARRSASKSGRAFVAPFTPGQIEAGRLYAGLAQRLASSGLSCVSVEALAGRGGGKGGDVSEARLDDARQLAAMRRRIGPGVALSIRRLRPSERADGRKRRLIRTLDLVNAVCCDGQSLSKVLDAHGWSVKGRTRDAARKALAAALDRVNGYR